jgi:hypothetical protein
MKSIKTTGYIPLPNNTCDIGNGQSFPIVINKTNWKRESREDKNIISYEPKHGYFHTNNGEKINTNNIFILKEFTHPVHISLTGKEKLLFKFWNKELWGHKNIKWVIGTIISIILSTIALV